MVHFHSTEYRSHTSCISEAQKYQGHLYREKSKGKGDKRNHTNGDGNSQAMVPRRAYVEDAPEGDDSQAMAVLEVPPRAPTPPPAPEPPGQLPEDINVFDFLVTDETPNGNKTAAHQRRPTERSVHFGNGDSQSQFSRFSNDGSQYMEYGFSYGNAPVNPSFSRYDSWQNLTDSQNSQALMPPPAYVTPAPKERRRERKDASTAETSDKKRKRHAVEDLNLSSSTKRPSSRDAMMLDAPMSNGRVLHSGLTGGLHKLITDPEFYEDRIEAGPTPILSPIKRSRRDDDTKKDRRKTVYVSHVTSNASKPSSTKYIEDKQRRPRSPERKYHNDDKHRRARSADRVYHDDRHRHRKHRESTSSDERPQRKQLKAIEYHPERPSSVQPNGSNQLVTYKSRGDLFMSFITKGPDSERGCSINKVLKRYHRERDVRGEAKDEEDKDLWKSLRLRRNDRGEIVLFI